MPVVRKKSAGVRREEQTSSVALELDDLRLAMTQDQAAWRRFVRRYDEPLRAVVLAGAEAHGGLADDHVDDVMGDFWLAAVAWDMRMLRVFRPERGSSLLTWLTFHVAQIAHEHVRRAGEQPAFASLRAARNVAAPPAAPPKLRREHRSDSIEDAIRNVVRDAMATELRNAPAVKSAAAQSASAGDGDTFISIERAASIADVHQATIRAWIRTGRLAAGRAGRHYRVRKSDVIQVIQSGQTANRQKKFRAESLTSWLATGPTRCLNS